MATTPEGKVKKAVKDALKILEDAGHKVYYHMPVQNGMGKPSLDFVCCIDGKFVAIEAKAPGKVLTPRQENTVMEMRMAGALVGVVHTTNAQEIAASIILGL